MMARTDLRHGLRIGRAEFVRTVRGYARDTRRILGLALLTLVFGGYLLVSLPGIYLVGRQVRTAAATPFLDPVALLLPVGLLGVAVLRTLERIGGAEGEDLLLTTVHPRAVVVGLLVSEIARLALWFGVPIVAVAGAFALGLNAPVLVVSAGLVAVPLVCCAAVWGYALGIALLRVFRRLPTLRRASKAGGLAVLLLVVVASQFLGQYVVREGVSFRALLSAVEVEPLTAYVRLAFVGTPLARQVDPGALVVLAGCVALTPVGFVAAERQATALWFTDGPARRSSASSASSTGGFAPPRPFAWAKAGRIAWALLVRTARKPQRLVHLIVVVFFVGPFGGTLFGTSGDGLLVLAAGAGVVLGAYLSGAAFGLNPLGDDRPHLPVVLLTRTAPRTFLSGRIVAGVALGLPLAVVVPVVAFAAVGDPFSGVTFAVGGVGWCLAAAGLALGLGCAYPIYEEREMWGVETVAPSTLVLMTYTIVVLLGTSLGLVLLWYLVTGHLAATGLLLAGVGVYALVAFGVPLLSFRYALGRYRRYTVD